MPFSDYMYIPCPYSVPIIALASQHVYWQAVPCHFDSTSILNTINTMIFVKTSECDGSPESQLNVNSNHISSNRKCFSGKNDFFHIVYLCVSSQLSLNSSPVQQIQKPVISLIIPITSVSTAAWNGISMSMVLSWLCSCVCRSQIPALQDEVVDRKLIQRKHC